MNLVEQISNLCGGICVPDSVWYNPMLTPTDVKLYKVLLDYGKLVYELDNGQITPSGLPVITVSQETLAEKVGVSVRTVQTCLERLKNEKLIKIDSQRGYKRNNHIVLSGEFYGITTEQRRLCVLEKEIKRKSVKRVPIKLTNTYEDKLRQLGGFTYSEKAIVVISKHYNMLVSRFNHLTGFNSLPKTNPQKHKNWKQFEKLFNLCREKGWDSNLYLEAQFDRARKYWKNSKIKYPLPNMLCSDKSQEFFVRFLKDREEKYAQDVTRKNIGKATKTQTVKQKAIKDIVTSIEYLSMYVREGEERARAEDKAVRIYHSWETYSPAYLWSVPWFREFAKEMELAQPENVKLQELLNEWAMIDRSKSLQEVILKTVKMAEKSFNIPQNIAI